MRQTTILYTLLICTAILYSCSRRPNNVLSQSDMANVLYDIQLAEAMMRNSYDSYYNETEAKDALLESVLNKHKISQADFDTSLVWYSDNMLIYMEINDSVAARLRVKAELIRKNMDERDVNLDAHKSRLLPTFFYLTETTPTLSFNIDSFKIKTMKPDYFKVGFDVQGLSPMQQVKAGLYFTYKDTSIQKTINVTENSRYLIEKPQIPDSLLKSISGYIHLKGTALPSRVMLYNIFYEDSVSDATKKLPQPSGIRDLENKQSDEASVVRKEQDGNGRPEDLRRRRQERTIEDKPTDVK